jgi:hypothetical protein
MCFYKAALHVDVTRRVVTCRSSAFVPDVHMRLGYCACARINELATVRATFVVDILHM